MNNIKIVFEFDGSSFFGYQRQPGLRTVQGEIEKIIKKVFNEEVDLISAGRTDRGVHAFGQTANFFIDERIPIDRIKFVLNSKLDGDIHIKSVEKVSDDFHSRFSAKRRTYQYLIKDKSRYSVFEKNYFTFLKELPKLEELKKILKNLEGEHDFNGFRKSSCGANRSIRTIYRIDLEKVDDYIKVEIEGNSFLKSMVRIIMGYSLEEGTGKKEKGFVKYILNNPNIDQKKTVAPAEGLYLANVEY